MEKEIIAKEIVKEIIDDLNDRRGCGIDNVDVDTQKEIINSWIEIVLKYI
jgi:hypothetical protein